MRLPRLRARTLRVRIASAFFLAALTMSGFVALATYALASEYMTRQQIDSVKRQSFNTLRFATEYLSRPESAAFLEDLASLLRARRDVDVVLMSGPRIVASSISVTAASLPRELVEAVNAGRVGHAESSAPPRMLVFGSHVPRTDVRVYLLYPLQQLDATLLLVQRILLLVVGIGLAGGAGLGLRLARLTIDPLRRASDAATLVTHGQLSTRLDEGDDELGTLGRSFNRMSVALQDRIAVERRFVADASHEIRTPLTALRASVEYMARAAEIDEAFKATADLATREVLALQRLVDDLLELSRMQAGAVEVMDEYVDLTDFAREVVRRRSPQDRVEVVEPLAAVVVRTDKGRLERIVGNLLENAMTHGRAQEVTVHVFVREGCPAIEVSDAGPGIRASDLGRVFDRFWRGETARRRASGAGLGLAIARENAAVLGAQVDLRSEPGGATVATVTMPGASLLGSHDGT